MKKLMGKRVNVDYYESVGTGSATNMKQLKGVVFTGIDCIYDCFFVLFNDSIYINSKHIVKIEIAEKTEQHEKFMY